MYAKKPLLDMAADIDVAYIHVSLLHKVYGTCKYNTYQVKISATLCSDK